jgi:hypothetical protein
MFRFFKRRKDKPSVMYPVFVRMNAFVRKKQQRAADWLQQRSKRYSKRTQLTGLVIFCLLFGGSSVCIVIGVLQGKGKIITVQPISVPAHVIDTSRLFKELPVLEQQIQENIQHFKRHLDSLYQYAPAAFDSVMKIRPGLIDSLMLVESIYQQQLKTK